MMRSVWLIRHAESQSNAGEVTDSPHSIGLSEKGRRHAGELAERFPEAPDFIIVSGYIRTRLTAQPTIDRFPNVPVLEWPVHEFTFLPPASYGGTTYAQRREPVLAYWERCEPEHCEGKGAESFNGFMLRIRGFLRQLRESPQPFIAVFAHGLSSRLSFGRSYTAAIRRHRNSCAAFAPCTSACRSKTAPSFRFTLLPTVGSPSAHFGLIRTRHLLRTCDSRPLRNYTINMQSP